MSSDLKETMKRLSVLDKEISLATERLKALQTNHKAYSDTLKIKQREAVLMAGAHQFVQGVASTVQNNVHQQVAAVVSRCLQSVFNAPYEFRIVFERKRGKTEANMVFMLQGEEVDPLTSVGGGIVDVTAFALRIACLFLQQPPRRRLLVLDEPFRFVSAKYLPAVRALVEELAAELHIQFIIVTHIEALMLGDVVDLDSR